MRDTNDERLSSPGNEAENPLEQLYADYVDRLNRGESFDPAEILAAHGEQGAELLEMLECFIAPDAESRPAATQLGDYTLRRQIGRGGMGVVYEAWENSMDRRVALKVLPAGIAADTRASARFLREAQTAGKLSHPNVVPVYFTGVKDQTPFYAMEYVEGETLANVLARIKEAEPEADTPFGKKDCVGYFEQLARAFAEVADGLQHAHSKGVIHRDIKPSNLILDQDGRLRILDFGLARLEGHESLTISGDVVGTLLYMSPEQARRRAIPIDHRTDVYSFGATMYEALTGRPPFRGKDHADTLSQIIERDPRSPRQLNSRIPADLETIVLKCLRKDAGDRYGTAEALSQDLRRLVRGEAIEARPESRYERIGRYLWRHRRAVAGVGFLLSTTLIALVVSTLQVTTAYNLVKSERDAVKEHRDDLARMLYVADIRLAHDAWREGNFRRYEELLERHVPAPGDEDQRGWEWDYLRSLAKKQTYTEFPVGPGGAHEVAWSPDGSMLAAGCIEGDVKVFDATTASLIVRLPVSNEPVGAVAWNRHGGQLAAVGEDGSIKVWSMGDWGEIWSDRCVSEKAARAVAWSSSGELLASTCGGLEITIRRAVDGGVVQRLSGAAAECINTLLWYPDDSRLAAVLRGVPSEVVHWETDSWTEVGSRLTAPTRILGLACSPDGSLLAGACSNHSLRVWEAESLVELRDSAHASGLLSISWNRERPLLASAGLDGVVKVWDTRTWETTERLLGHGYMVHHVEWSPDGSRLASAGEDDVVRVWETTSIDSPSSDLTTGPADWSPDGERMAVFDAVTSEVWVGDRRLENVTHRLPVAARPEAVCFSPDGRLLAAAVPGSGLWVWDWRREMPLREEESAGLDAFCLAWSPASALLVAGHYDGAVRVHRADAWKQVHDLRGHERKVGAVAWSPDGGRVATTSTDLSLRVWDARSWERLHDVERGRRFGKGGFSTNPTAMAWSPDGEWFASTCVMSSKGLRIWDGETFELVLESSGHTGGVLTVAWSPDGTRLATGGWDLSMKLWRFDDETLDELLELPLDLPKDYLLRWHPEGRQLLADFYGQGTSRMWEARGTSEE